AGTTGESPTLTHDEQGQLFRAVREAVNVPITAGTGSNDTRAAVDLTKRAVLAGVDGL
ncbi:MAG TPA: 4-hydroxy-tetrahydrodipicolinate synthase, partial [Acidimicrobiaceae bacterium]|nr:4-hydroxy-tetrahydrodipicolinate synthase [Acidimicrobiaceae bacterium]